MGTINISTMRGREEEVVALMEERALDLLGLCETRLKGEGMKMLHNNYVLVYSGGNEGRHGVGVVVKEELAQKIGEVRYINDRILSLKLNMAEGKIGIVQVYAPQQGRPVGERNEFYEILQETKDSLRNVKVVIMGDLNGHVGVNRVGVEEVIGAHSIGGRNEAGEDLIDFCVRNSLSIMNTYFQHRESHKWTWYRWNGVEQRYTDKSMIDLVLSDDKNLFKDVKVIPSVSCDSDHRLVVVSLRVIKPKLYRSRGRKRYKIENLQEEEKRRNLTAKMTEFKEDGERENLQENWQNFKTAVEKSAEETVGCKWVKGGGKKKTPWWTEEMKNSVKNKMQKFRKWMKTRRAEDREMYVAARNETERVKEREKRKVFECIGRDLENDMRGTRKLVYSIARGYRRGTTIPIFSVKNKNGTEVLTEPDDIMARWKEYFTELLNIPEVDRNEWDERVRGEGMEGEERISMEEVRTALKDMRNGKAPGEDGIPTEILKHMGDGGIEWLHEILNQCWENKEVPDEWNKIIICPIYKKGDKMDCGNYRGIALGSHVAKIYERILERRLREVIEPMLGEWQNGFRAGRSTVDMIFCLRMIYEKSWEWNKRKFVAFVDLEKAFDRIPRQNLWEMLVEEYGVARGLVKAIKSTYKDCKCRVKSYGESGWFNVETGVKQGSVLSPLLFITYMDFCNRRVVRMGGGYGAEVLGYADDIAIICDTEQRLQEVLNIWDNVFRENGMKISIGKTEVMAVARVEEEMRVTLGGQVLKQVDRFKYLGVMFEAGGGMKIELDQRIAKYNANVSLLYPLLRDESIPRGVKVLIYTTMLRPILTYGHEGWAMNTKLKSKIQASEMRVLRIILGVTRRDRMRNDEIRRELGVVGVLEFIQRGQLRWYGHVRRMNENRYPKRYLEWMPREKRPAGRPRRRWMQEVDDAISDRGGDPDEIEESRLFDRRDEWRRFVMRPVG